jgi:hypothetical protein
MFLTINKFRITMILMNFKDKIEINIQINNNKVFHKLIIIIITTIINNKQVFLRRKNIT